MNPSSLNSNPASINAAQSRNHPPAPPPSKDQSDGVCVPITPEKDGLFFLGDEFRIRAVWRCKVNCRNGGWGCWKG